MNCLWHIFSSVILQGINNYLGTLILPCGHGSSDGIATAYWLDGPGTEPGGGEIFRACPDRPCCPHSHLYNGYRVFPRGKMRPGRAADYSPLLVPRSWKHRAITQPNLCATLHLQFCFVNRQIPELFLFLFLIRARSQGSGCTSAIRLILHPVF
jgi:hypothetical protein